jgi:serine phosphatase RsbU (regulator of sigma subunit)
VGGDFFTELPGRNDGEHVVVYGDVSGKSISGALMMMAAHEVLNSVALAHPEPEKLLHLANERLYTLRGTRQRTEIRGGSFVALGYLGFRAGEGGFSYTLAGQPPPSNASRCRTTGFRLERCGSVAIRSWKGI